MKRYIFFVALGVLMSTAIKAQTRPYHVVFDLTSKDSVDHKAVIRWLKEISESNPNAKLEVVLYAQSLDMITQGRSAVEKDVTELAKNKNIAFRVCAIAMKNNKVEKSQLIPGVETVPDGIYEIILKQGEGYGYIKAAR